MAYHNITKRTANSQGNYMCYDCIYFVIAYIHIYRPLKYIYTDIQREITKVKEERKNKGLFQSSPNCQDNTITLICGLYELCQMMTNVITNNIYTVLSIWITQRSECIWELFTQGNYWGRILICGQGIQGIDQRLQPKTGAWS